MVEAVWLIPALPLLGFVTLVFLGKRLGEPVAGWVATVAAGASFVAACVVFAGMVQGPEETYQQTLFTWLPAGRLEVDLGFFVDHLSITMVLFITGIGTLIHLYSIGYMHGDPHFSKFFLYLNLFVFSMLMLVLGDNLLVTFLGWEGVGACSYFLISFWFTKDENASAGKKAFVTNRVGDWGFLIAIFATFMAFGSLDYATILPAAPGIASTTATFIAVMLLVGAIGKSAQIPLYLWLPDAMAGPTPVSALIHAATMVTAGVYLLCRVNPILATADPWVSSGIAWLGVGTALVASLFALAQMDIKKGLAFSTISQIGYMFLAVGTHAYWVAIFHMITHAFFKACLFLGSGSVIHGMHGEQDMRRYGALRKFMPITAATFGCAWLAISGIPPFSGFWSKDEILAYALDANPALYAVGLFTALLTAYYMSRIFFRTFYGEPRWEQVPVVPEGSTLAATVAEMGPEGEALVAEMPDLAVEMHPEPLHGEAGEGYVPHESPWTMTTALVVLAFFSVVIGFINIPFGNLHFLEDWLEPVFVLGEPLHPHYSTAQTVILLTIGALTGAAGIAIAWYLWLKARLRRLAPVALADQLFYDQAVSAFMNRPGRAAFEAMAWFDRTVIDGAVRGIGVGVRGTSRGLRHIQSGYVRRYALGISLGAFAALAFMAVKVFVP